jgi:hypothetical protein
VLRREHRRHPNRGDSFGYGQLTTNTNRDVDYWGVGADARFGKAPAPMPDRGGYLFRLAYVGIGGDVRGIDQDNRLRLRGDGPDINYTETLDTTYAGAFLSAGGEYNLLGILGIGGSLALRSLLSLRGGILQRRCRLHRPLQGVGDDDAARPRRRSGGLYRRRELETRKQFGPRTSLSLVSDYEWYSSAPQMKYVNADRGGCSDGAAITDCPGTVNRTHISDDDAFEVRTTLRLNIGLGSPQLYSQPLK